MYFDQLSTVKQSAVLERNFQALDMRRPIWATRTKKTNSRFKGIQYAL